MSHKLLVENIEDIEIIKESAEAGRPRSYYLRGTFLQGNIRNRNGRIYPTHVLANEVTNYTDKFISKNRAFGELNHPTNPSINLDKVSHLITEIVQDGNNFIGTAKIIDTPMGKIVKTLMDEDCILGVSSRGLGTLKESSNGKVVDSFILTTGADIVADPSGPDCFPDNLIENIEWIFDGKSWQQIEQKVQMIEDYKQQNRAKREENFLKFLNILAK